MNLRKIIGEGNTATVYEWGKDQVLKLFRHDYPEVSVIKEFNNIKSIYEMPFLKPKAHKIVTFDNRFGIIYDRIYGESLQEWLLRTGNVKECATIMANLHKEILNNNKVRKIPNYRDFLVNNLIKAIPKETTEYEKAFQIIHKLEDGNTLCHGDFHPGNIFITGEEAVVIDFMNICYGSNLYDIARTVFLVEYTPIPIDMGNRSVIKLWKKEIIDNYLKMMNITREMINDYIDIITITRKGECPNEY